MTPAKVLIVDDNRDLAENLAEILTDEGYACAVAFDGPAALDELARSRFELVITDLRMTPTDGLAVVDAARVASPDAVVVLMTAFAGEIQLDAARAAGVTEVVAKPVDTAGLVEFIRGRIPCR